MRKLLLLISCALLSGAIHAQKASYQDTLILNDGKIVTGLITQESFDRCLFNVQANINTWHTDIDQGEKKPLRVENKDINFFIINGQQYANRHVMGGNKMVRIVIEGPQASIYTMGGFTTQHHTSVDRNNPKYDVTTTTSETSSSARVFTELYIKGKGLPYNCDNPKYIITHFDKVFTLCPKLIEESKQPGFDFTDLKGIAQKYNACF